MVIQVTTPLVQWVKVRLIQLIRRVEMRRNPATLMAKRQIIRIINMKQFRGPPSIKTPRLFPIRVLIQTTIPDTIVGNTALAITETPQLATMFGVEFNLEVS